VIVIPSLATSRDVIVHAPAWVAGVVNRAERVIVTPGGKPLNVARFLGAMGVDAALVVAADASLLRDVEQQLPPGVVGASVLTVASSRTDVAIAVADGELTVINGPVSPLSDEEMYRALGIVRTKLDREGILVVAGSQPPTAFARLVEVAQQAGARLVIDVSGPDLRAAAAIASALVKVNAGELAAAFGIDEAEAWDRARELLPVAEALVVTRGAAGMRGWLGDGTVVDVPAIDVTVANPYGAGDAVTAALTAVLAERPIDRDALLDASAWAAAAATDPGLGLDPGLVTELRATVRR
jgi:fructose-1-phosphate kinase PfkB-like protein